MKTAGLIGGMSWESSAIYYRLMNEAVKQHLGGLHSAPLILHSLDFAEIAALQAEGNWHAAAQKLIQAARGLKAAGADFLVICTNTMHKLAGEVQDAAGLPVLHIVDAVAHAVQAQGLTRLGLLATRFTMEEPFYIQRFKEKFGITLFTPDAPARADIHRIIFEELCKGKVTASARARYLEIAAQLQGQGAQGIVLGCTEIGMLLTQENCPMPVFDSTLLHAKAAVRFML